MNILDKIVTDKYKEVDLKKSLIPTQQLETSVLFNRDTFSLANALCHSETGIIAEHKRRSPSKGTINQDTNVGQVAKGYKKAGVCGMSVLTDIKYFGGSLEDLQLARASVDMPLLRKEFIIDEYQIIEAKANGADVILLIAAVLSREEIKTFSELAQSLDMLGVNNRNLKAFEVSLETSKSLSRLIPNEFVKVSESGISSIEAIKGLKEYGYQGFLIGENFMKTDNPGKSAFDFIQKLK